MEEEKSGKGGTLVSKLANVLFTRKITPSLTECFGLLLKTPDQNTFGQIFKICREIATGKDKQLFDPDDQVNAICAIVKAAFIACEEEDDIRMSMTTLIGNENPNINVLDWLCFITTPLIEMPGNTDNNDWPKGHSKFAVGVVLGIFEGINRLGINATDDLEIERDWAELISCLIYKPSDVMRDFRPSNKQIENLNNALRDYIFPWDGLNGPTERQLKRRRSILFILEKVKNNFPEPDPWDTIRGKLRQYHLSNLILEKLLFSVFGTAPKTMMIDAAISILQADKTSGENISPKEKISPSDCNADEIRDPETLFSLAIAYKEMGLLDDAVNNLQRAFESFTSPDDKAECLVTLSVCHKEKGNLDLATTALFEALKLQNQISSKITSSAYFHLALICHKENDLIPAKTYLLNCLGIEPNFKPAQKLLAEIEAKMDNE